MSLENLIVKFFDAFNDKAVTLASNYYIPPEGAQVLPETEINHPNNFLAPFVLSFFSSFFTIKRVIISLTGRPLPEYSSFDTPKTRILVASILKRIWGFPKVLKVFPMYFSTVITRSRNFSSSLWIWTRFSIRSDKYGEPSEFEVN